MYRHANAECQLYGLRSTVCRPGPKPGPGTNKDRNLTLHHGAVSWQRVKEDWLPPSNCLPSSGVVAGGDGDWGRGSKASQPRMCMWPVCPTSIEWHRNGIERVELPNTTLLLSYVNNTWSFCGQKGWILHMAGGVLLLKAANKQNNELREDVIIL